MNALLMMKHYQVEYEEIISPFVFHHSLVAALAMSTKMNEALIKLSNSTIRTNQGLIKKVTKYLECIWLALLIGNMHDYCAYQLSQNIEYSFESFKDVITKANLHDEF